MTTEPIPIYGYCQIVGDRTILAFSQYAPILEKYPEYTLRKLVKANSESSVVGYSVVKSGRTDGFLHYPCNKKMAEEQAERYTRMFGAAYFCIPLAVGNK